jgi:hypothetical protein
VKFYLGAHHPAWLWNGKADFPLFVSHASLRLRKSAFPPATVPSWALDSMGFTMLRDNGEWTISPREYAQAVARYDREIGRLDWAAPQDWMCENAIINGGTWNGQKFKGTHLTVDEHQRRTVANFLELAQLWPGFSDAPCPFRPVLQGEPGNVASYLRCAQMYEDAGIHLADYPLAGIGSVCRIQDTDLIGHLARGLRPLDLKLHWFGVKLTGLPRIWPGEGEEDSLASFDSMAWSIDARRAARLPGCTHVCQRGPKAGQPSRCANCPRYAAWWRDKVMTLTTSLGRQGYQGELFAWGDVAA